MKAGPDRLCGWAGDFHLSQRKDLHTRPAHPYVLCGWHTRSEIPLTGMPTSAGNGEGIDVLIQIASGTFSNWRKSGTDRFLNIQQSVRS